MASVTASWAVSAVCDSNGLRYILSKHFRIRGCCCFRVCRRKREETYHKIPSYIGGGTCCCRHHLGVNCNTRRGGSRPWFYFSLFSTRISLYIFFFGGLRFVAIGTRRQMCPDCYNHCYYSSSFHLSLLFKTVFLFIDLWLSILFKREKVQQQQQQQLASLKRGQLV